MVDSNSNSYNFEGFCMMKRLTIGKIFLFAAVVFSNVVSVKASSSSNNNSMTIESLDEKVGGQIAEIKKDFKDCDAKIAELQEQQRRCLKIPTFENLSSLATKKNAVTILPAIVALTPGANDRIKKGVSKVLPTKVHSEKNVQALADGIQVALQTNGFGKYSYHDPDAFKNAAMKDGLTLVGTCVFSRLVQTDIAQEAIGYVAGLIAKTNMISSDKAKSGLNAIATYGPGWVAHGRVNIRLC